VDANRTRFHLLTGRDDWAACSDGQGLPLRQAWDGSPVGGPPDLAWDAQRGVLTLRGELFEFPATSTVPAPTLDDRRGAAADRYGNWYWIDRAGTALLVNSAGTRKTSHFWAAGDGLAPVTEFGPGDFQSVEPAPAPAPLPLGGLTVTEDHYLIAGVAAPAGLLVFDLHAGGPPRQLLWPAGVAFAPFDMAPAPGGGAWILDRAHARYWALDRGLNVVRQDQAEQVLAPARREDFQPQAGGPVPPTRPRTFPQGITLGASSPVAARDAIAIEGLPDGTVLILDRNPGEPFSLVYRYRFGRQLGPPASLAEMRSLLYPGAAPFRLTAHDFAFVPEHTGAQGAVPDRLYVLSANGKQAFAFLPTASDDTLHLRPLAEYLPLRLFGGKALVGAGGRAYYDFGDGWVPLVSQPRLRYADEATLLTPLDDGAGAGPSPPAGARRPAFDGRDPDCKWHRLALDACIPAGTEVQVWSRAANEQRDLAGTEWQPEPPFHRRGDGSEQPFVRPLTGDGQGTWELLFQQARGRYLQLRLRLVGDGRSTPRLRALRAYYPRFSYLDQYLPAVYREDPGSASFLERFLANPEGTLTAVEDRIAAVPILFDRRSTPPEALDWLAGWFGVVRDPAWDDARLRLFLTHAMDFFQYRGTVRGLRMALRLALDACPDEGIFNDNPALAKRTDPIRIVEPYRARQTPGVVPGDPKAGVGVLATPTTQRWQPAQGRANLSRRYADFLAPGAAGLLTEIPLTAPPDRAADWRRFAQRTLGFVPSATDADRPAWRDFLARRYHRVGALNDAYQTGWASFEDVPLPQALPPDGVPLTDWFQFEAIVLPMRRRAHRFSVLLPAPLDDTPDGAEHRRRLELARRVVEAEKPAHTVFDVKFFWAFFRLGEARLGEDTLLDLGSRAPQLMPPVVLGRRHLAESYLAPGYPQDVAERRVLGRDRLNR
jgi:phage tail-like protein